MKNSVIHQLNKLNKKFYSKTASHFDDSRQYYWQGWLQVLPFLKKRFSASETINVIDLGCGNGRFGSFLNENLNSGINYLGIDNSAELLAAAEQRFSETSPSNFTFETKQADIVENLLEETFINLTEQESKDVAAMFGVWHHIPSQSLRLNFLKQLASLLKPNGLLVFTVWKFLEFPRFRDKVTPPESVNIDPALLEENDYILDWRRGTKAYRYCHYSTDEEIENTIKNIPELKILKSFRADGKEGNVNQYLILQKSVQ